MKRGAASTRVTNADLLAAVKALNDRLTAIELEARVAKWFLRILTAILTYVAGNGILQHLRGK